MRKLWIVLGSKELTKILIPILAAAGVVLLWAVMQAGKGV